MIDVHCHIEHESFSNDRDEVIEACKKELKAIITACTKPENFELMLNICKKHRNFVFAIAGLHPIYAGNYSEEKIAEYIRKIKASKHAFVGIGEIGLDYHWVKEEKLREKQEEVFRRFIEVAKEIDKPMVIHSRKAVLECVEILEEAGAEKVLMHLFSDKKLVERVAENDWYISVGPIIARSKDYKKIAKRMPMSRILLETDSPWFGNNERGTPLNIKIVAQKIAEVKKTSFADVWEKAGENAVKLFGLKI